MNTGLIGPSPFVAAIILIIILVKKFEQITKPSTAHKILAVLWGVYVLLFSFSGMIFIGVLISACFQIFFMYWYLKIAYYLEEKVMAWIFFLLIGAAMLAFLNKFIYVLVAVV